MSAPYDQNHHGDINALHVSHFRRNACIAAQNTKCYITIMSAMFRQCMAADDTRHPSNRIATRSLQVNSETIARPSVERRGIDASGA